MRLIDDSDEQLLFSIILPTFNRRNELKVAIDSIFRQTYRNWQLIIVDNESTDGTLDYLASLSDSRIKFIQTPVSGSIAKSRNLGLSLAEGEWIAFIDSDDYWLPNKLREVFRYTSNHDLIHHAVQIRNLQNYKLSSCKSRKLKTPVFKDLLLNGNAIINSSTCVKSDVLRLIGGQNEDPKFFALEDFDCWLRISEITEKFFFIEEQLGVYTIHGNNSGQYNNLQNLEVALQSHLLKLTDEERYRFRSLYMYYGLRKTLKEIHTALDYNDIIFVFKHGSLKLKILTQITFFESLIRNLFGKFFAKAKRLSAFLQNRP